MDIQIYKQLHIAFFMTEMYKNAQSLTLVTLIPRTKKFTAPFIRFVYAQYVGTFTKPFIWCLHCKCLQNFILLTLC